MTILGQIFNTGTAFVFGYMLAMFFVAFILMRQPVITHIIATQNQGIEGRFIVDCTADETGYVRCRKVDGGQHAD